MVLTISVVSTSQARGLDCVPLRPDKPIDSTIEQEIHTHATNAFKTSASDFQNTYKNVQQDALSKYPNADKVLIWQINTYFLCTLLDSSQLNDEDKTAEFMLLIRQWSEPNAPTEGGPTENLSVALLESAKTDDVVRARTVLLEGADVNTVDGSGDTPLTLASQFGNASVAALLSSNPHVEIDRKNNLHQTALMLAVLGQHLNVVRILLSHPSIDTDGALVLAATGRSDEIFDLLITPGSLNGDEVGNALVACHHCSSARLEGLLAIPNVKVSAGPLGIALEAASQSGYTHVLELVFANRTAVAPEDLCNAFDFACKRHDTNIADVLLHHWPDPDSQCGHAVGLYPVLVAADMNCLRLLQERHVDLTRVGINSNNVLTMFASEEVDEWSGNQPLSALPPREEFVKALVSAGLDVNHQNADGDTALHLAAQSRDIDLVRALLNVSGIEVNLRNNAGKQPLDHASAAVATLLKASGAKYSWQ